MTGRQLNSDVTEAAFLQERKCYPGKKHSAKQTMFLETGCYLKKKIKGHPSIALICIYEYFHFCYSLVYKQALLIAKNQALNLLSARERIMHSFDVRQMVVSLSSI